MLKISIKITLLYFTASTIIIVLMGLSSYFIYYGQRLQSIDDELKDYGQILTSNLSMESTDISFIYDILRERKNKTKKMQSLNFQFLLTSNDSIFYESNESLNLDKLEVPITELDDNQNQKTPFHTISVDKGQYRVYIKYIKVPQIQNLELIMVTSLDRFYQSLNQLRYILFIVSPMFLIVAALIGYIISRRAFAPVRNITKTAEKITAENLDMRVPVSKTDDEIAMLAKTFNDMIDRLYITFNSQKKFIADASHDFRTPLTIVRLELEMLNNRKDLKEDVKKTIDKCIREIKSLSNLAENLLLLARADSHQLILDKKYFRLDELLVETILNFKNIAISSGKTFKVDIDDPVEIKGDKEMLKRAVINILDNALKYSPQDSSIKIALQEKDNFYIISVSNPGDKIPKEILNKLFDRFERVDKSRTSKGFGLGLPIIKAIAEAHNGKTDFTSEDRTIKVCIYLPK